MRHDQIWLNGEPLDVRRYGAYHKHRIQQTLDKLGEIHARDVVELGGHPWIMTAHLIDDPRFQVCATVSAEEVTNWPDDLGVSSRRYCLKTSQGREASFTNYSANLERTRFGIAEQPDTVIACEIIEHLIRSPHVMLLNVNSWLPLSGKLLMSTPNGAHFNNPLRRKPRAPAYRCHIYERHHYVFTLDDLVELVELCGFNVREAGYWKVYERTGFTRIYDLLGYIPLKYAKDKFRRLIYLVAEKNRDLTELPRIPRVYAIDPGWEFIAKTAPIGEPRVVDPTT
jgi:hypothetical protein